MNARGVLQRQSFYMVAAIGAIATVILFFVAPPITAEGYTDVFMSFWASVGAWLTASVIGALYYIVKVSGLNKVPRALGSGANKALLVAAVLASGLFHSLPSFAQTPVPIDIPTDVIFSETNNWIATFAPISAIGIGIAIAIAVLGYIGKMIVSGFRG